jgi:hypothetical protein
MSAEAARKSLLSLLSWSTISQSSCCSALELSVEETLATTPTSEASLVQGKQTQPTKNLPGSWGGKGEHDKLSSAVKLSVGGEFKELPRSAISCCLKSLLWISLKSR